MSRNKQSRQFPLVLDEIDWKILEELNVNPRIKINDLAEKIEKHRNTISTKLTRDFNSSPIKTVTKPNYTKLNYTTAYIFATAASKVNNKETAIHIAQLAGVEEVEVISGEWDFLIKIRAQSIEQIGSTIIEQLKNYCDKTVTAFSFWSFDGTKPYDLIRQKEEN